MLYLMSYGHRREVLKPGYQALHRDRKVGRGREIRTPDILLPKQARYQTALYPDAFIADACARPRFSGGRIILTPADSVNVGGGYLRTPVAGFEEAPDGKTFHWEGCSWDNTP